MFFENVGAEATANPKMMIVHEVMGRDCGWLTAATAAKYRERLKERPILPMIGVTQTRLDVHGVYVPELSVNIEKEAERLRAILDANDNVNVFISEGAGVKVQAGELACCRFRGRSLLRTFCMLALAVAELTRRLPSSSCSSSFFTLG